MGINAEVKGTGWAVKKPIDYVLSLDVPTCTSRTSEELSGNRGILNAMCFLGRPTRQTDQHKTVGPAPSRPIPTPDLWDLIGREQLHRLRDSPSPLPRECPARMTGNVIQFYRPYTRWGAGPEPWARSRWVAARISLGGGPTGPRGILLVVPNLRGTGGSGGGGAEPIGRGQV